MKEIRCPHCHARLFDADAQQADRRTALVVVRIKCWRCKTTVDVYLFARGDQIGVGCATPPDERRNAA